LIRPSKSTTSEKLDKVTSLTLCSALALHRWISYKSNRWRSIS